MVGHPTDYDADFHNEHGYRFALLGFTVKEIAQGFGVNHQTIKNWFKKHPEFFASVTRGRVEADAKVAEGLFKRATGFRTIEQRAFVRSIGDFTQEVEIKDIEIHYPPDAGAALNWLKNRQPGKWRDKQDVQLSGEVSVSLNLDGETKPSE